MLSFISASENYPFAVALAIMFGIALLEGISSLFGAALSGLIDAVLPDMPDLQGPEIDLDSGIEAPDVEAPFALSRFFSWLRVGQVPVLMLIVIFLTAFGLIGLGLQTMISNYFNQLMPGWLACIPATLLSFPMVRLFGGVISRYMPGDETEAVSVSSLVGRVATITIGTAATGKPAEARVKDRYGTSHLLMVEPDKLNETFSAGDQVLLIKKENSIFKVISNPNLKLTD